MTYATSHLTPQQLHRTVASMERHGGAFCAALAQAWFVADKSNKRRIEGAFPHLVEAFGPGSHFYTNTEA